MPTKNYAYIAKEGHSALFIVAACAVVLQISLGAVAALPAWFAFALLLVMFRDPTQTPPSLPLAVVSPIHGRVTMAEPAFDPWLRREAQCVVIRTQFLDIRSIYAPVEGKIVEQWSSFPVPVEGHVAPPHSSAFHLRTDENDDVTLVIIRGDWGGRLSFNYNPGERVGHGRRVGYANFGCMARVYLPVGSRCDVARGVKVAAGSSVIATLVHLTRMAKARTNRGDLAPTTDVDA